MLDDIVIRRPKMNEAEKLNQFFSYVIKDTFAKEGLAHLEDEIASEIESKRIHLEEDLKFGGVERYFLIAQLGERIIGTIEYGRANEIIIACTNGRLKDVVEIGTVFIEPDYQGNGIGTLLLKNMYCVLLSRNIREFCLDSGYKTAQKIWKKKFGEPDYLIKDYWGQGTDHMIWRKEIEKEGAHRLR